MDTLGFLLSVVNWIKRAGHATQRKCSVTSLTDRKQLLLLLSLLSMPIDDVIVVVVIVTIANVDDDVVALFIVPDPIILSCG